MLRSLGEVPNLDWGKHVIVVPIGSVESHGPLPPGLDCEVATCFLRECECRQAVFLHPIPVSTSWEHYPLEPTASVSVDTFARYLREVAESLAKHFRAVVLAPIHGGSKPVAYAVARELRAKGVRVALFDFHSCVERVLESRGIEWKPVHADPIEASIALACLGEAPGATPVSLENLVATLKALTSPTPVLEPWTWREVSERYTATTIPGSPELGKEILSRCCEELCELIEKLLEVT